MTTKSKKNIEAVYPLSPMQEGMLFHSLYAPETGIYFVQFSSKLRGDLSLPAFKRAWQQVIQRHSILRTSFVWKRLKRMLQVVNRQVELPFELLDWRGMAPEEQEERFRLFLQEDRQRGFKLSKAPLLRLTLIQLSDDTYRFVLSNHHLIMDGWSLPLLFAELFTLYEAYSRGQELVLPPSRPYKEYIDWLQKQDIKKAEAFWRETLSGVTHPTPLVVDRLPQPRAEEEGLVSREKLRLSRELTEALQTLGQRNQLTLNTIVQSAWAVLLHRYSGEHDVLFGATVSGRPADLPGVEKMIGLFINTLPVRARIDADRSVLHFLQEMQRFQTNMREFEYSPLVQVQSWSEIPRGVNMFDSIVVFENYPVDESLRKQKTSVEISEVQSFERTNFPLTLISGLAKELSLEISYDSKLFNRTTILRMLAHLQVLLQGMAENPEQKIKDLPLLPPDEEKQILIDWNATAKDFPSDRFIHQLFEEQAVRTPRAVALEYEDEQLTYQQLNRRVNQLAHYLRRQGVGPDILVGVYAERSIEMVVALLGILKAGGAYVPLDPGYPAERIDYMIHDSGVKVILTQQHLREHLPTNSARVICLDSEWEEIGQESEVNPRNVVNGSNLAYVIYTSGSTGKPKGTGNSHQGILNRLQWMQEYFRLDAGDAVLQKTPFSFDVSVWEFFWPLMTGARLVMARPEGHKDSAYLVKTIMERKITTIHFVPSMLQVFLEEPGLEKITSLRRVICSGEALSFDLTKRFYSRLNTRLYNLYGPTEAAVDVTYWTGEPEDELRIVPIGRPISNIKIHLLDSYLRPVPIGVPGELHIGGVGLARGYWERPDLTAEKFIPDPFSNRGGERLYKTGDLARYLPDGNIEYLGRLDFQVKVRGFRIELGEIEAVLEEHPGIREAVVTAQEDSAGTTRLVAYFVAAAEAVPPLNELREYLKERLPEYMVPSVFVRLEALPLTPSGKVDRKALPAPDSSLMERQGGYIAPRTPVEELLASLWSEILGVEQIGIHDNFFDLGGHSLLATQLISRIRDAFGVELPLRQIFEAANLADLAAQIEMLKKSQAQVSLPPMEVIPREGKLPLSFAQQRLWFLDQLEPGSPFYNIPAAIRLRGDLDVAALEWSLGEIVRRHETLRTTFASEGGEPYQVIAPEIPVELTVVDLAHLPPEEREKEIQNLANKETQTPFDLARGPLFRMVLLHLSPEDHVILLTMHHIISDGWSIGIMIRELAVLYESYLTDIPADLPELPVQYADYAAWQKQWLQGEVLEQQLEYWRNQLAGSPPVLELPTDHPRPPIQSYHGGRRSIELSAELSDRLRKLSRQEGVTLFMTLLAVFQSLLHRYSGQNDILVGTPISGRTHSQIEHLIGFFVNTLVLRSRFENDPTFRELLRQVREVSLEAYAHQELPFEKLVEELQPARDMSHSPIFQVMFVFQNLPFRELTLPGLTMEPLSGEMSVAKFDLTLNVAEGESGLEITFEYNRDLFNDSTIARMADHYQRMLEGAVENPDRRVSRLPLLSEREQRQILKGWNDTRSDFPRELCIHQLFERRAEANPDAVALVFETSQMSYGELNQRSNQLAHYLRKMGVGPEVLVGLSVDRSLDMVIGILGILKAGGAFVPLDPLYPTERLSYMVQDSGIKILLTQQWLLDRLPVEDKEVICLDRDWKQISQENTVNPVNLTDPENAAYIIYTSGSTGRPKGTLLRHRGMCNLSTAEIQAFQVGLGDRVLQFSSLSFDAAVWEIVMALSSGATLCLARREVIASGEGLVDLLRREFINNVTLPPSVLALLPQEPLPALHTLITAGEKCSGDLVNRWSSGRRFFNAYGPTESTVCASTYRCEGHYDQGPPIGRPIPNFELYILDTQLQPVPIGVPGELHIAGEGLARGYLKRSELTAEKFIPHPFSDQPGARLYRTGDLARFLPDGNIEFLGRIDHQVKVRGFRIELAEIEALLEQHPSVKDAVVIVREDTPGDQRLVAYLIGEGEVKVADVRHFLREHLPEYMVPSIFMVLEEFPLTPNGKIDREALPAPDQSRPELSGEYVPPRNSVEEQLARICSDLLKIEKVGIYDSFFDLGGHSLLATQFISRLRENFGVEVPLRQIFETPTVAGLAEFIQQHQGEESSEDVVKIERLERGEEDLEQVLQELEHLSEEEVKRLLASEENLMSDQEGENE